mmetsp:Transcript_15150/g.43799  ORF Transcript_15150/g.43799 Transcript_15150/m.43799 type:complete len:1079 (+) Transcript_15150:300-3536(+)
MKPHFLALYSLIGVVGVVAWSNPSVTVGTAGRLQSQPRHQALFASSQDDVGAADAGAGEAAGTNAVSIEYNAAAKLAYDAWRQQYSPPPLKASQRVLLSAEEVAAAEGLDPAKFSTFERNYVTATVANAVAKKMARDSASSSNDGDNGDVSAGKNAPPNLVYLGPEADSKLLVINPIVRTDPWGAQSVVNDVTYVVEDISIPYDSAARLAYKEWLRDNDRSTDLNAFDPSKFALFERNYKIVAVANIRAKRAASMYGGEAEIATLGSDADTVALPLPPSSLPDTATAADAAEEVVDVSIQYNAPARLAYDEWLAANGRAGEESDNVKFGTFEQNYVAVTVTNVSAKKAARDAGESADAAVPLMELGSDADSVISGGIGGADSTSSWGIFGGMTGTTDTKLGTLSFGKDFGESLKWKPSNDDRLRSALGIDASSSSDSPDTGRSAAFFFTKAGKEKETPHPPEELPSDRDMKDHASDRYEVLSEGDQDLESKTVPQLKDMLKSKSMPASGEKSELIDRLQSVDDAGSEVVKETKKNMEREYGISISADKVREILTPILSGKMEANVSTDAIKGAALAGAALPILAGAKGAGLSLAALSALSSSYLAVTQGYGGDAARVVGELAWKSTGALKSVGTATKSLLTGAVNVAKEKNREQMLEAVAKGDADAAAKLDKDVQKVLAEAEEAVAAAERAAGKSLDALNEEATKKAEELAKLEDEELLAKEFQQARMEEMRAEASAQAQRERIKEDQRRAEEDAARLAEEDRLEEEANRLLAEQEERLAQEREVEEEELRLLAEQEEATRQEEELRRIAAAERAARLAAEAEAAMLLAEQVANRLQEEQASAEALAAAALDDVTKEEEELIASEAESEKVHALQDAAEDADIAAQARAAVEAMEQMEVGLPDFDEDDASFLGDEDLEAAIALAQELEDDKIAGVDNLLQALRELDADGDIEDDDEGYPDFDEDDATFSDSSAQKEQARNPEDLARAAREAVALYEAEMAAKSQERMAQKSEWAEEVAAVAVPSEEQEVDASPPAAAATDWASLTVVKLKDELRSRGLKVGGRKAELIQRLEEDDMSR